MFPRILRSCHQGKLCQKVEGAKWANATKLLTYVHHSGLNKAKENMSIRRREKVQKWKFETLMPRGSKSVLPTIRIFRTYLNCYQPTVWKNETFTLTGKNSSAQLYSNFFSKTVTFTRFLPKKRESKFP